MSFIPLPPVDTLHLFPGERDALLALLADLTPEEWARPTICPGWSVQDIAAHLLADDVGRLSRGRDDHDNPDFAAGLDISTLPGLIAAIDRQNALWVEAMRGVSPRLVIDLLRLTGSRRPATSPRSIRQPSAGRSIGSGRSPRRSGSIWPASTPSAGCTSSRSAMPSVAPACRSRRGLRRSWPRSCSGCPARSARPGSRGKTVLLALRGKQVASGWRGATASWGVAPGRDDARTAAVTLDQDSAWRLFTKGLPVDEARNAARIEGDVGLAERVFATVSILA